MSPRTPRKKICPLVSVIVLNYNGKQHLADCFDSIARTTYPRLEVIMVDNGSNDRSVEFVKTRYPFVKIVQNEKNVGFAEGNNVGVRVAKGEYVAFLNNDTRVDPEWISELVRTIEKDVRIAACATKMVMFNNPLMMNGAGGVLTMLLYGWDRGLYEEDKGQFEKCEEVPFACAGAMLARKDILLQLGPFDKRYFIYCDDVDLGIRMWLSGCRVVYVPTAIVHHKYSATMGQNSLRKMYLGERNTLATFLKDYEGRTVLRLFPHFLLNYLRAAIGFLLNNSLAMWERSSRAIVYMRVLVWNILHVSTTVHERTIVQRSRKMRDRDFFRLCYQTLRYPSISAPDYEVMTRDGINLNACTDGLKMGDPGARQLGYGWHGLEYWRKRHVPFRWTKGSAKAFVRSVSDGPQVLSITAFTNRMVSGQSLSVRVDEKPVMEIYPNCHLRSFERVITGYPRDRIMEITLIPSFLWVPDRYFQNSDQRKLGVGVTEISLRRIYTPECVEASPLISFIVVNRDGEEYVGGCLSSIRKQGYRNKEIIVVDDASSDSSLDIVRELCPEARVITNSSNLGAAKSRNLGIQAAKGEYLVTLDNDAWLSNDWLTKILEMIQPNRNIGICMGKILMNDSREVINSTGAFMTYAGFGWDRGIYQADIGQYDSPVFQEILAGCSAAMMVRAEVFNTVGLFDPYFFYFFEDVEFGLRARIAGYDAVYVPEAVAYHSLGGTVRHAKGRQLDIEYFKQRNRLYTILKNFECTTLRRHVHPGLTYYVLKPVKVILFSREDSRARVHDLLICIRSVFSSLRHFRHILESRRKMQTFRKKNDLDLRKFLSGSFIPRITVPDYAANRVCEIKNAMPLTIRMGFNDLAFLGYGWQALEYRVVGKEVVRFRHTQGKASVVFMLMERYAKRRIILSLKATSFFRRHEKNARCRIRLNGRTVAETEIPYDHFRTNLFDVTGLVKEHNELVIRTMEGSFMSPAEDSFNCIADFRKVGIAVSEIAILALEDGRAPRT